ncbi:FHA domain-containing protein [Crocosphaera sp. UHCC 0190]|uniref:FHA domain-containing protein n=1 Tax=Crocosphaera sp. UHCC 0190 TaxID=3110246 RepID=UPI002B1F0899|nr:FHA domain-containing protein [Crocosphaera sp. UHCC 0190]MEA5508606.1 FHA domain-containing protein [Crocosphaera sp. UHCC 0190]
MAGKSVLPQRDHFLIIEDDKGRQEILLQDATYTMGRSQECNIRLRSQFVSRHHATVYRRVREDGSSYYRIVDGDIEGKRSVNGLLINGIKESARDLQHGDEIVFGPQVFAIYQYRQRDKFPTLPSNDPFDITLIDPAMMDYDEDTMEYD